jgi:membrane-associated protein
MEFLISALSQYKYLILFPLSIVEGPIVIVIAGFLCSCGILNPLFVFPIIVIGDMIGDFIYYSLGRWSQRRFLEKLINRLGVQQGKLESVRIFFQGNPGKTILFSKIFLGVGILGLVMAGNAKLPFRIFLRMCLIVTLAQSAVYLSIGLLFGQAFIQINQYLNWLAATGIISFLAILVFLGIRSLRKAI